MSFFESEKSGELSKSISKSSIHKYLITVDPRPVQSKPKVKESIKHHFGLEIFAESPSSLNSYKFKVNTLS